MVTGPIVKITKAMCSQIHSRSANEVPEADETVMTPRHARAGGSSLRRPWLAGRETQERLEASTVSRLPSSAAGLLLRLTKKAATRQITATTMAPAPRSERVALARASEAGGWVILPRKLGNECAGSMK